MLANIYASILNWLGNFQIFVFFIKFFMTFEKYPINRECLLMGYKQAISFDWINFKFSIQWESKASESILSSGHSIFGPFEKYPINRECFLMGYLLVILSSGHSIFWSCYLLATLSSGHSIFWSFCLLAILACTNWCFFAKNRQI